MYQCLKNNLFEDQNGYKIIPIRAEDMELIRLWRNAQIDILRQKTPISYEEQQIYFRKNIWPTFIQKNPQQILFSFFLQNELIGYGGLTNMDWEALRGEISFLVNLERGEESQTYKQDFSHFLNFISRVAFEELHFHKIFTETFAFREKHMKILETFGFQRDGILREHVFKRNHWYDSFVHSLLYREWNHGK